MPIIITNEPSGKEARHIFLDIPPVKRPVYGPNMTKPHEVLWLMIKPKQSFLVYMRPKTSWLGPIMNSPINGNNQGYMLNISNVKIKERIKIYRPGHKSVIRNLGLLLGVLLWIYHSETIC